MIDDFMKRLQTIIDKSDMSIPEISKKSGVCAKAIYEWRYNSRTPNIKTVSWVLEALGYRIIIQKKRKKKNEEKK